MTPNRHFLLTNGRSGSNYFAQLLNLHPQIVNYGEVLGEWTMAGRYVRPLFRGRRGAAAFLDWIYSSRAAFLAGQTYSLVARQRAGKVPHYRRWGNVASLGIKEFTANLVRFELGSYLADRSDLRLITLVRNNVLDRLVSMRLVLRTGTISSDDVPLDRGARAAEQRITLDPETIVRELERLEAQSEAVRRAAARHQGPVFRLVYEEFFAAPEQTQKEIVGALQTFLGARVVPLSSEHRRLRRESLRQVIANYDEIAERLTGGPFAAYLSGAPC